jgi:aspartyl/asparaginyl-tRNA synthetase
MSCSVPVFTTFEPSVGDKLVEIGRGAQRHTGPKIVFIILRQQLYTLQGILTEETDKVSENMVRWAEGLSRETIVLVEGKVQLPPPNQGEIKTTTVHTREVRIEKVSRLSIV